MKSFSFLNSNYEHQPTDANGQKTENLYHVPNRVFEPLVKQIGSVHAQGDLYNTNDEDPIQLRAIQTIVEVQGIMRSHKCAYILLR